jgi:hypothetical protein
MQWVTELAVAAFVGELEDTFDVAVVALLLMMMIWH